MHEMILHELVAMSQYLGEPHRGYAILGEGNTSARVDDDSFYVKASGFTLGSIDMEGFCLLSISKVTEVLEDPKADDDAVTEAFKHALLEPDEERRPSTEAILHATLLRYPDVKFVGHTHPIYTNMILCSQIAEEACAGRLCPDHIVVMAHKSLYVPYTDPGLMMAREIKRRVEAFVEAEHMLPKAILIQNHGLFALGKSPKEVTNIHDMCEKMAQVLVGTYALGGPRFMPQRDVDRIFTRPDEAYRQAVIAP